MEINCEWIHWIWKRNDSKVWNLNIFVVVWLRFVETKSEEGKWRCHGDDSIFTTPNPPWSVNHYVSFFMLNPRLMWIWFGPAYSCREAMNRWSVYSIYFIVFRAGRSEMDTMSIGPYSPANSLDTNKRKGKRLHPLYGLLIHLIGWSMLLCTRIFRFTSCFAAAQRFFLLSWLPPWFWNFHLLSFFFIVYARGCWPFQAESRPWLLVKEQAWRCAF